MRPTHLILFSLLGLTVAAQAQPVGRAFITIPTLAQAPKLDGVLSPGEWDQAAALANFQTSGGGALGTPATTAYLYTDTKCLYVAFHCIEPDANRPYSTLRAHDDNVYADDCVQVFIAPEDMTQAKEAQVKLGGYAGSYDTWYRAINAYFEFTVNASGSMSEAWNDVREFNADWQATTGKTEDGWVAELAIPFASIGVEQLPEDVIWGLNLFRCRQPDLTGWINTGHGGYSPLPLGAMRITNIAQTPVIRELNWPLPNPYGGNIAVEILNPDTAPREMQMTVTSPSGEVETVNKTVSGSAVEIFQASYQNKTGSGTLRGIYEIKQADSEEILASGIAPFWVAQPESLDLRWYGVDRYFEGLAQISDRSTAKTLRLSITGPDGEVQKTEAIIEGKTGERCQIKVSGNLNAEYLAKLEILDADGKVLAIKERQARITAHPDWMDAPAMPDPGVLPPWTPMEVDGQTVSLLGRQLTFANLALPAEIESAAAQILAAPMSMVVEVDGKPVAWRSQRFNITEQTPEYVVVESVWSSVAVEMRLNVKIEYDGFCWVELTLRPRRQCSLDHVAMQIPIQKEIAKYCYQGHSQACGAISPAGLYGPMRDNFWVGDEKRGIAFMLETSSWQRITDKAHQVQIIPGTDNTLWQTTLVDTPFELTEAYKAQFALQVTPAKPVSLKKSRIWHGGFYGLDTAPAQFAINGEEKNILNPQQGTVECWVRPTFNTKEEYLPGEDVSKYNRMFMTIVGNGSNPSRNVLMFYYNADDRSLRLLRVNGEGAYDLIMSCPQPMVPGEWSHVAFSWGDKFQISINGKISTLEKPGKILEDATRCTINLDPNWFDVDDFRISSIPRVLENVPAEELTADADTLYLETFESKTTASVNTDTTVHVDERFANALTSKDYKLLDQLAEEGKRIVIFHENWSRYQGYPDTEQIPKLRAISDGCHERGMLFLIYFGGLMSDAAPEWADFKDDIYASPERMWYHRDDVVQDCYVSCVNGPFGQLLLNGIKKLSLEADIDGVYMDGTTVPWPCANPTHDGCGQYLGNGAYSDTTTLRATREFMKRLRKIFVDKDRPLFLDAHTGGAICIGTLSFCDGFYEGETLHRYKKGFKLTPDVFATGYMGQQFGFRSDLLVNRLTMNEGLAISLIHDTVVRGQPAAIDKMLAEYEDEATEFIGYWRPDCPVKSSTSSVLVSVYRKTDRALIVLGNQGDNPVECELDLTALLENLPDTVNLTNLNTKETLNRPAGITTVRIDGRDWRILELK